MTHRKFPQPTQAELDHEDTYLQTYNPYWWELWQGFIGSLANPDKWEDYEAVEEAISELMLSDEVIESEWFAVFDFETSNGGFSVVSGGGGQWVSGNGWQATNIGTPVQAHIEKSFDGETLVSGFLISYITGSNVNFTREVELTIQVDGSETTWYFANSTPANAIRDILVDGSVVEDGTRIRVRLYQSDGTASSVRIVRLLMWGNGNDPFQ